MTVKVLIVDEDERERIVLRYIIEQANNVEIVGEAVRVLEALLLCQEKKVDLVFINITSYEMMGLETVKKFESLKGPPLLVFISEDKDMAAYAYELGLLDYIIKPIEQQRIEKTIDRAKYQMAHKDIIDVTVRNKLRERVDFMLERYKSQEVYANKLPVREKGKVTLLNQSDVVYCESQAKKVFICTADDEGYLSNYTLNELEQRLDSAHFFRAHQAFIVNLNYIKEIINFGEGSYILHLNNGNKNIILSRSRAKLLRQRLGIQ